MAVTWHLPLWGVREGLLFSGHESCYSGIMLTDNHCDGRQKTKVCGNGVQQCFAAERFSFKCKVKREHYLGMYRWLKHCYYHTDLCMCLWACQHNRAHFSFTSWALGIQLRASGLVPLDFTCEATSPAQDKVFSEHNVTDTWQWSQVFLEFDQLFIHKFPILFVLVYSAQWCPGILSLRDLFY